MVRFAGNMHAQRYRFWLDVPAQRGQLSVALFVKHLRDSPAAAKLLDALPDWASPAAVESYQSRWEF